MPEIKTEFLSTLALEFLTSTSSVTRRMASGASPGARPAASRTESHRGTAPPGGGAG